MQRLSHFLRPRLRLPLDPEELSKEFENLDSGVALPLAHCAFRGCAWMHLDELPERNGKAVSHVHLLNEHLKHSHVRDFASACGLTVRPEEFLDYYEEACKEKDRQRIPDTGVSLDRRTLAHMREAYGDARVQTLICLVCAEKPGSARFRQARAPSGPRRDLVSHTL